MVEVLATHQNQVNHEPKHLEVEYIMESHYIKKLHFYYIRQIRALGQNGLLLANT
jgi:hypothetical protein